MKDKRLDVLLGQLAAEGKLFKCKYYGIDHSEKFCKKGMPTDSDGFPEQTSCDGNIVKCELEEEEKK